EEWAGGEGLSSLPRASFAELDVVRHHRDVVILDVRRQREWDRSHLPGSVNIPIHEVLARIDEVPAGEGWVHCEVGYRASIAASLLGRAGRRAVVAVDDEFRNAKGTQRTDVE